MGEAHHVEAGESVGDEVGQFRLAAGWTAQCYTVVERRFDRCLNARFGMALKAGGLFGDKIGIAVAVDIGDVAAVAAGEREGKGRVEQDRAGIAAGH